MLWSAEPVEVEFEERAMRGQIVAFLEEYCRGMTLRDARECFADSFGESP
jgi:hypothetical protein